MSELPPGWTTVKLAEVAIPRGERVSPRGHASKPFIGLEHVEAHSTRILGSIPASEVKSSTSLFRAGDVLYGRLRPYLNKVAKPDFDGLASAEFIVFPDQEHLRSGFLKHRLNASDFVSFSSRLNAGDRPRVDFEQIGEFVVVLPPPAEQQRIVEKLEELLSDLDAGVTALERACANLKRYRAAVLKAAVEGRLTEKWRAAHPDVEPAEKLLERILVERKKKWEETQLAKYAQEGQRPPKRWKERYPEPVRPDVSALSALPDGWCWATIDQCARGDANAITDGPFGSNLKSEHYTDSGPRVIRLQNIGDAEFVDAVAHISDGRYASLRKHAVSGRDVVVAMLGEVLPRACLVPDHVPPAIVKADCAKVSFNENLCVPEYANCALNSDPVRKRAASSIKGVGRPRLNLSHVRAIAIPLPPLKEQFEIWAAVSTATDSSRHQERDVSAAVVRSAKLRQAILRRAFEGKLVPQDPQDEPASELLARIRAERSSRKGRASGKGTGRKVVGAQ